MVTQPFPSVQAIISSVQTVFTVLQELSSLLSLQSGRESQTCCLCKHSPLPQLNLGNKQPSSAVVGDSGVGVVVDDDAVGDDDVDDDDVVDGVDVEAVDGIIENGRLVRSGRMVFSCSERPGSADWSTMSLIVLISQPRCSPSQPRQAYTPWSLTVASAI